MTLDRKEFFEIARLITDTKTPDETIISEIVDINRKEWEYISLEIDKIIEDLSFVAEKHSYSPAMLLVMYMDKKYGGSFTGSDGYIE